MNYKRLLILFAIPILSFSQQFSDEELLEMQLPIIYKVNRAIFSMDKYYEKYEIDTLNKVEYFDEFNQNNPALNIDNIECELSILESSFPGIRSKKQQVMDLSFKVNMDEKLPRNKTKIIEYNLTDSNNKKIVLMDSLGHSRGGGSNISYQMFYFQNLGFGSIKGHIDLQFKFLTGYKNYGVNREKGDSLIRIGDKTIKILEYKENYIVLKGDKELLQKLEYSNLTNNNFHIVAAKDEMEMDLNPLETNGNTEVGSLSYSSPSSKTVLPSQFFDVEIRDMAYNEYKLFFNKNRKAFEDQEYMCLIKFNTKIINLYLHLPTYEKTLTKKIHIDSKIITR